MFSNLREVILFSAAKRKTFHTPKVDHSYLKRSTFKNTIQRMMTQYLFLPVKLLNAQNSRVGLIFCLFSQFVQYNHQSLMMAPHTKVRLFSHSLPVRSQSLNK